MIVFIWWISTVIVRRYAIKIRLFNVRACRFTFLARSLLIYNFEAPNKQQMDLFDDLKITHMLIEIIDLSWFSTKSLQFCW